MKVAVFIFDFIRNFKLGGAGQNVDNSDLDLAYLTSLYEIVESSEYRISVIRQHISTVDSSFCRTRLGLQQCP